jgi:outer membrane protein TolC
MKLTLLLASAVLLVSGTSLADELSLAEAEQLALQRDPQALSLQANAQALREQAIAEQQLPDPMLKLGAMNFPTDSFSRSQEPMTQLQLGVVQRFPRGDTLQHSAARSVALGEADQREATMRQRMTRRAVRLAWLDTYYWLQAAATVRDSQALFAQLVEVTHARYAVGGRNQQDVINAELELDLLRDREQDIMTSAEEARARLARWVGTERARAPLPKALPELHDPGSRDELLALLPAHPSVAAQQARVHAAQQGVELARQAYKPGWTLDLTYGQRSGQNPNGSDRADFASAMVMLDVPLFTAQRQDRQLAASQHRKTAAVEMRQAKLLDLQQELDTWSAKRQQLQTRIRHYAERLLPQARDNAEAALNAYQADRGDFTMLMRARITELNTALQALKLRVDHAKAQAQLLYLAGDAS